MSTLLPTQTSSRIQSLDIIRGVALLGILLMNIQSFSMPDAAYLNPTTYGDLTGINFWVWSMSHVLIDSKFMAMFSMLFGAGVLLFLQHAEAKHGNSMALHYRRMGWLLLFGLIHAHLIWSGDVLFLYAVCGFWIYFFRNASVKKLWISGLMLLFVGWLFNALTQMGLGYMPESEVAKMTTEWAPSAQAIQEDINAFTGTWLEQFGIRSENAFFMQTFVLLYLMLWRAGGLMLIGMALYKQGLFTGKMETKTLLRNSIVCLVSGYALVIYGVIYNFQYEWQMVSSQFAGSQFNYIGSVLVALGYVHGIAYLVQKGKLAGLSRRLAAVGRMAFTNYISHSLICTFIFYGFGLGLYGSFERWEQVLLVFVIWGAQLIWSPLWLNKFRYGPLEWGWRRLTYWNPLKREIN
jgi:uncharacterized protein